MEILCSVELNSAIWKSRLYGLGIFLLVFSLCWSEPNTFQTSERTASRYSDTRSNFNPQNSEPSRFISDGNFTNGDKGAGAILDFTTSPTEPSRLITAKTTITATLPKYAGFTDSMLNYSTETSFTTIQEVVYGVTPVTTLAPPTPSPWPTCPDTEDWYLFNNFCYYFSADASNSHQGWKEANTYCMNNGGYLVSIHGSNENDFIKNFASTYTVGSYWIGLREYAASGKYEWSDSSPLDYQMWSSGEPNDFNGEEECVQFYLSDGTWNDLNCGDKIPFICKKAYSSTEPITHVPTPVPAGNCPGPSVRFNNKCYLLKGAQEDEKLSWQDARAKCAEYGMLYDTTAKLATIHTQELQSFLSTQMQSLDSQMWIGLSDITTNDQFRWADGVAVDFTYWGNGEPNEGGGEEDCVEMSHEENTLGEWNDVSCTKLNGYICEHLPSTQVPAPAPVANDCRTGYTQYLDSCFKVLASTKTFSAAFDACKRDGTSLASINNAYEQAFVETLVHANGGEALWIGLVDEKISGLYSWVDGWPVYYTNWGQSEPSKGARDGCVAVMYNGDWDDTVCDFAYMPLCKYSLADPPTNQPESPGICEDDWVPYGNSCYQYQSGDDFMTSWPEAEFYCTKMGAYIASVYSKQENEWIRTQLAAGSTEDIWIGLHRTDSVAFKWQDDSPVGYVNWAQNEPTYTWDGEHENCVEIYINDGKWNDVDCLTKQSYVCKKPKIPIRRDKSLVTQPTDIHQTQDGNPPLPNGQSAKPQKSGKSSIGMSSGGIIGLVLGILILLLAVGFVIFFVFTRHSPKQASFDVSTVGFDNALYCASKGTVQVTEKKGDDIAVISAPTTVHAQPGNA